MRGLNHPGIDAVDHMRDSGMVHEAIKRHLSDNHRELHKRLTGLTPAQRLPGQIFELRTLEVALAYNDIRDLGSPAQLRRLTLARQGMNARGKPLASAFHAHARDTAMNGGDVCLVAKGMTTKFE